MKRAEPCSDWRLFPLWLWIHVALSTVQATLRALFEQWGKPQRLRVDNGPPWGPGSDLPPPLILWVLGLGILPIWNRPARPTDNPKVERANGLVSQWGEPEKCADFAAWEEKLEWVARRQREEYPTAAGMTLEAHAQLLARPRPYAAAREAEEWQLGRVTAYLTQWEWPRQVSQKGQISIYGKAYRVGERHGGKPVWLRFDAATHEWVVRDKEGVELARHPAEQITTERICRLQVSKPHASSKKRQRRPNSPPHKAPLLYAA
jgi:hypothetical protein